MSSSKKNSFLSAVRNVRHFFRPGDKVAEDVEAARVAEAQTSYLPSDNATSTATTHTNEIKGGPLIDPTRRGTIVTADDPLGTYRMLIGITSHPNFDSRNPGANYHNGGRAAPNIGIFTRIVRNEMNAKSQHKIFSVLVNFILGLQIVFAAALTALGAAQNGNYGPITALGALNTIIAGFLSYLKGSGLPDRLKWQHTEWKKIREFIEQRERELSREGCDLDVYEVVAIIEAMYEDTKTDIEQSRSAASGGGSSNRVRAMDALGGNQPLSSLTRNMQRTGNSVVSGVRNDISGARDGVRGSIAGLRNHLDEKSAQAQSAYDNAHANISAHAAETTSHAHETLEATRNATTEKWKSYEDKADDFGGKMAAFQSKYGDKINSFAEDIGRRFAKAGEDAGHHASRTEEAARDVQSYARERMSQLTLRPEDERSASGAEQREKKDEAS